ncbi:MAG: hypothetical protein AAFQ75_02790 [Pseudomonadota bacterium]
MKRPLLTLLFFALFGGAAAGQDTSPCPMTYAQFEFAIPHLDIDSCPAALSGTERFCRASTSDDQVHVFAFEAEGEQCLIAMTSLDEGGFELKLN